MTRLSSSAIAAVLTLTCAFLLSACEQKPESAANQERPAPKAGFVILSAEPYTLTSELPGRTAAYRIAEVRPQVNGIIQKRLFKEGSDVKTNQQLYQIDPAIYDANLKTAQADLLAARTLAERYKKLVDQRAVSRQQYDDAHAKRLAAEAALERAKIEQRYTRVLAPISGRISRSMVTEGALVSNGQAQELATIQQLDPIYVDVTQSANELLRLRRELESGQLEKAGENAAQVKLKLQDNSTYPHQGRLEFSEVSVDAGTGSVTLRAVFPNPDNLLLPGMFVHASLISGVQSQAILAPQQGITRNPKGEPTALVLTDDNIVELRHLKAERTDGSRWLVTEGLQEGDRLITEGLQFIQPGASVDPYPASNVDNAKAAENATNQAQ
ncbi:efflux RND transporter periplasmic adaptor subunit [Denitrificimonas sp. JX-1]|uniref:Efflux RND transporter periplasmic adaptor subunit n=1 Tax=Denitrificimonas halotolerans TaxID=3098930 RepID=A0ABU5GTJ9_9GAMM|nr:efflux RND transporter periplasmic adaptor subunit [Denitrificimonas sp. JX-1]MDY7219556.1 efflux RND transporter periplasmic adaptor subunit [Denitrificimonas sp. JX-1]